MKKALVETLAICWLILVGTALLVGAGFFILCAPAELWIAIGVVFGFLGSMILTMLSIEKVWGDRRRKNIWGDR